MSKNKAMNLEEQVIQDIRKEEEKLENVITHIEQVKSEVDQLHQNICNKDLHKFSCKDIMQAMFGSLIIGLTFVFKGLLVQVGMNLSWSKVLVIILTTLVILVIEIYFVGYRKVKDKKGRPWHTFVAKRLLTMYLISLFVSMFLLYIFGFLEISVYFDKFMKLVFIVAMPCAVGSIVPNMLKK